MKCRSVVLGYLGTQDQSYFISVLPAARTAKSTGTADDDQFNWTTHTVFPHIRPAGIIILFSLQIQVLLENTTFLLHKVIRIAGIIRGGGLI